MSTAVVSTNLEVVALMTAWARWQRVSGGTVKPKGLPRQAVEGSKANLAGVGGRSKGQTAKGKETRTAVPDTDDRHWSPEVARCEAGLTLLRVRRIDLFLVLVAHYLDWVPNGRGGWRHVQFDPARGLAEHQKKLSAMLGSKRLPNGRLRPAGAREFANRLREAHLGLEMALPLRA